MLGAPLLRGLVAVSLLATVVLAGCGDDTSGAGGSDPGAGGGTAVATGEQVAASTGAGSPACSRGLVACEGACVDLAGDEAHCGACDAACPDGQACRGRTCVDATMACETYADCGEARCESTSISIDHCGGCGEACDDDAWCASGACVPRQGDGTSCESPFVIVGDDTMQFWFEGDGRHLFTCGPFDARPAMFFRWTATNDDDVVVQIAGAPTDDLVIEVFTGSACDESVALACNDTSAGGDLLAEAEFAGVPGKTYFVAIGSGSEVPPPGRFGLRMDD